MYIRYRRGVDGTPVAKALVYTEAEHGIRRSAIDPDAIRIIQRLKSAGHSAYIVGGAVRDLLQDRSPKDFDLVTDAVPAKIRKLFRNARIIGRRFRLVHIVFGEKIFEVSTFRSNKNGSIGNEFGTIDEDVQRRDFSINALYLDPIDGTLVDYVGGFKDIKSGKLKPIIPLQTIFKEDPVRILRAVKYAAIGGFSIPLSLRLAIKRDAALLSGVSSSRMTEEFFKVLTSGKSAALFGAMNEHRLLGYLAPSAWQRMREDVAYAARLFSDLAELDSRHVRIEDAMIEKDQAESSVQGKRTLSVALSYFLRSSLDADAISVDDSAEAYRQAVVSCRSFILPLNPPRVELEAAVSMIFKMSGVSPLQKPPKARKRRRPQAKRRSAAEAQAVPGEASASAAPTTSPHEAPPSPPSPRSHPSNPGGEDGEPRT